MTKDPKQAVRSVEETLREAFRTVETQPTPPALADHVDLITAPARRSDPRS